MLLSRSIPVRVGLERRRNLRAVGPIRSYGRPLSECSWVVGVEPWTNLPRCRQGWQCKPWGRRTSKGTPPTRRSHWDTAATRSRPPQATLVADVVACARLNAFAIYMLPDGVKAWEKRVPRYSRGGVGAHVRASLLAAAGNPRI